MKRIFLLIAIAVVGVGFIIFIALVDRDSARSAGNRVEVTASFYPLYFFAQEIGKEHINVVNITPAGSEPHDFEPTGRDIARIESSDILILNGVGFEPWYEKIKHDLSEQRITVIETGNGLELLEDLNHDGHAGEIISDPHVWLSPVYASQQVEQIKNALIQTDPQNTEFYEANARDLLDRLEKLDLEFREGLNNCKHSSIVTSHAAFAYLAHEYGLRQVPISGLTSEEEPSSQKLAQVARFAKQNQIKYIFFERLVSPKFSDTIAHEVGAQTLVLDPLEGLSEENIKNGKSYFTVMQENLQNLQTALECQK